MWTMWYDTIYGCQDLEDDIKAGVKSTATLYGGKGIKPLLSGFGVIIIACILVAGMAEGAGMPFFVISLGGGSLLFARGLRAVDLHDPASCLRTFNRNGFVTGAVIWLGMLADYLYKTAMLGYSSI